MAEFTLHSAFIDPLHVQDLPGKWWRLTSSLRYRSRYAQAIITVPKGFVTDLASVRFPLVAYVYSDAADRPSVVHDYLYRDLKATRHYTRKQADDVFFEAMGVMDYGWWYRWSMWSAVRADGWRHFREAEGLDMR